MYVSYLHMACKLILYLSIAFLLRSLIALAAMMKFPEKYQPETDPDVPALKLRKSDFLHAEESEEHLMALRIMRVTLEAIKVAETDIMERLESVDDEYVDLGFAFKDWK